MLADESLAEKYFIPYFAELSLRFFQSFTIPGDDLIENIEGVDELTEQDEDNIYRITKELLELSGERENESISHILGWPFTLQGPITENHDDVLLFELVADALVDEMSDEDDPDNLSFDYWCGDSGIVCFSISEDSLSRGKFEEARGEMQYT